ncbi:SWR1-complex protein 4 isoform X2 [Physcomitrium patens]|uniref:Myb-like domain-containing protein n=1 Tax=Physcomitrium patens TaxID=3218 RepID=A0A7I4D4Y7_PHYPA|nr:SWR1-complex protein 4-like isoform X2 [Physcomitrium patens]|eukprot:XP_024368729.1 SWR1-complex protein 4-like isoform X2 [Physcomitrella patens]
MGDAMDILGLMKLGDRGSVESRKTPKDVVKKPDGVHREVYALTGGLPPIMPTLDPASTKKRPAPTKKISWQWLSFSTTARTDNLQLYHWVQVMDGLQPSGDYAFAKYNKGVNGVRYTDEEYNQLLVDPNWSREETDRLFDMCEQFDLRFIIIADRFSSPCTIEELKHRYYSAAKSIIQARAGPNDDLSEHAFFKVIAEARRITETRLKAKDIEEAQVSTRPARHVDTTPTSPTFSSTTGDISFLPVPVTVACTTSVQVTPVHISSSAPPSTPVLTPAPASGSAAPPSVGPRPPRVYLRGAWLTQQIHFVVSPSGVRTAKRVDQILEEYRVQSKPNVPTATVCAEHLELRRELLNLLQLQKQVQYKETELAILRDNPCAGSSATPNTPKRFHRGLENERVSTRATPAAAESEDFPGSGERVTKREYKRKALARFQETPTSPPYHKRGRKLKGSES